MKKTSIAILLSAAFAISPAVGFAQMKGHNVLGDYGLQSGTRATPGLNIVLPLYDYNASTLRDDSGNAAARNVGLNSFFTGLGLNWELPVQVLGGYVGGTVIFPFVTNLIETSRLDVSSNFAFTDIYLQPIHLGWHRKRADYTVGYGLFIPTGKFSWGALDNSGLGMWSNEFSAGATLYFDAKRTWTGSMLLSYELHSKKKDSEARTGDILSIEGGFGKTLYHKVKGSPIPLVINVGVSYYAQYKVTNDKIPVAMTVIDGVSDQVYGVGPEVDVLIPKIRSMISARWFWEPYAKSRFKGNTFLLTFSTNVKSWAKE